MNELFDEQNAGSAVMEVDRLLSEFYKAQLPHPWPALKLPLARATSVRHATGFARSFRRLALAASVVLALVAYWALAGLFHANPTGASIDSTHEIGDSPFKRPRATPAPHLSPVERQRTPAGNDAQLFEEDTPGGIVINVIGPSTSKGPR